MPNISLTNYPSQLAEIQRQQALAQALQQSSMEPLEPLPSNGAPSPISNYAGLAKLLQGYVAQKKMHDATQQLTGLNTQALQQAQGFTQGLLPTSPQAGASQAPAASNGPALAAAMDPTAATPSAPQPQPQPQVVSAPIAPGDTIGPFRDTYQRALAGVNNPNPFIANTAKAALPALQAQMDHAQAQQDQLERQRSDQAFQAQQKDAERQADVTRAQQIATQVLGAGHYTPQQAQLVQAAAASGSAGLNSILGKLGDRAFAETNSILSPAAVKALGLPDGSVVSQNDTTKAIKLEYNPLPDQRGAAEVAISRANEQLHAQSVGIEDRAERFRETQGGGMFNLSPEEQAALSAATAKGLVDPNHVNGRNMKFLAQTFMAYPGLNMMNNHAFAQVMASAPVQQKVMLAENLPVILKNVADAGKAVNYSNIKVIGGFQQWAKQQTNNPAFVNYMNQRNDAIQAISSVARGTGNTDLAIKMEAEAANPTMSPQALDAWLQAQMTGLKPRLDALSNYSVTNPVSGNPTSAPPPGKAPVSGPPQGYSGKSRIISVQP